MKKKYVFKSRNQARDNKLGYLFLSPWILGLVIFTFIPMIMTFVYSFANVKQTNFGFEFELVGFTHYTDAFLGNLDFTEALLDFLLMEVTYVPVILIIAFIISLLLNKDIKGRTFFRIIFFLPVIIISGSLINVVFPEDIVTSTGEVLEEVTTLDTSFIYLMIRSYSKVAAEVIKYIYENFVLILWFTGIPIILFLNGLQKINKNIYESAEIDGANSWQILWKITIPNVRGLAAIISVFSIVQLSIMPTSKMYSLIETQLGDITAYGRTAAYSAIYAIAILLLIGIAFLIITPKEKKTERKRIMKTQHEQLQITLQKMKEGENAKKRKKAKSR